MNNLKVIIFDSDDTLVATRSTRFQDLIKAAADFDQYITPDDIKKHWGKPFNELISSIIPQVDFEAFYNHYAEMMRNRSPKLLPGVRRLLQILTSHYVQIWVLSSGSRDLVHYDLENTNIRQYISRLWGYEDTFFHKPDPRTLEPVLTDLKDQNVQINQTMYVGDSISDFKVAISQGMPFCAVLTGSNNRVDFLKLGLENGHIFNSLEEILVQDSWFLG